VGRRDVGRLFIVLAICCRKHLCERLMPTMRAGRVSAAEALCELPSHANAAVNEFNSGRFNAATIAARVRP
jgi:hypothetical protein